MSANCIAHGLHTKHQCGKTKQNGAGILLFISLAEHIEDNADQCKDGGKIAGLQHLYEEVFATDAAKAEDPAGHRCTHICTHDHIDRLGKRHDAGVNKTNDHDRGGRGALNDRRYTKTGQPTGDLSGRQGAKQGTKSTACAALKSIAHDVHAKEEQAQAADHCKDVKKRHLHHLVVSLYFQLHYIPHAN